MSQNYYIEKIVKTKLWILKLGSKALGILLDPNYRYIDIFVIKCIQM